MLFCIFCLTDTLTAVHFTSNILNVLPFAVQMVVCHIFNKNKSIFHTACKQKLIE